MLSTGTTILKRIESAMAKYTNVICQLWEQKLCIQLLIA